MKFLRDLYNFCMFFLQKIASPLINYLLFRNIETKNSKIENLRKDNFKKNR